MLRDNNLIKTLLIAIEKYREYKIDIVDIQQKLSAIMSALESDVPKEVRERIFKAEAEIDSIRFTINTDDQYIEVNKTLDELESLINKY